MEFKDRVKAVRLQLFYSQEHLAKELNVSYATVNRWENGKCLPNYDAQKTFHEFCINHTINFEEK